MQLSSLDSYIGTIGCNITKFNTHVKLLLAGLSARGETSNDLFTNLFKGTKMHQIQFLSITLVESKRPMRMGRT